MEEELPFDLRGEMAVVADPDRCGDDEYDQDDEDLPATIPEGPSSASTIQDAIDLDRASSEGMAPPSVA